MKKIIVLFFLFVINVSFSQNPYDYKTERNLFNLELINTNQKTIITKKINDNEKFTGRYLGKVKTKVGNYYIIESSFIFNLKNSPTAENHIFLYNNKKQKFGYYYLNQIDELPSTLKKGKLYFNSKKCKDKIVINLSDGIPKAINLKCNGEDNYYELQKENE